LTHSLDDMEVVQAEWKEETPIVYSIEERKMFFVNRDRAIDQLIEIHNYKYKRAVSKCGADWEVPLIDNVFGLGKSEFGVHYIKKCRESKNRFLENSDFKQTLCSCHTVHIVFEEGALLSDDMNSVLIEYLVVELKPMFKVTPSVLSKPPSSTSKFLKDLTREVGPLFIVLDEIGFAFESEELNDFQRRKKFMDFCNGVIRNWLFCERVFFILMGRGSFLSYVGARPGDVSLSASPFIFKRISLQLLRPDKIATLMHETTKSKRSLVDYYGLKSEEVEDFAKQLYEITNGHPRSLLEAFCESPKKSSCPKFRRAEE